MSDGTYILKSTPNYRFLRNSSCDFYLLSQFLPEIWRAAVGQEIFSYFRFDVWPVVWETFSWQVYLLSQFFARNLLGGSRPQNIFISGETSSLKSTLNDRFFDILFIAILFNFTVFDRNLLGVSWRRNIFIFSFWCLSWGLKSGLTSIKPTHYLLNYIHT